MKKSLIFPQVRHFDHHQKFCFLFTVMTSHALWHKSNGALCPCQEPIFKTSKCNISYPIFYHFSFCHRRQKNLKRIQRGTGFYSNRKVHFAFGLIHEQRQQDFQLSPECEDCVHVWVHTQMQIHNVFDCKLSQLVKLTKQYAECVQLLTHTPVTVCVLHCLLYAVCDMNIYKRLFFC